MRTVPILCALGLVSIAGFGAATHETSNCVIQSANPATYNFVAGFYDEERNSAVGPVPGSGLLFPGGGGTWIYEETNGIPGLQRGGESWILGDLDSETINDQTCTHGPDRLWV